MPRFAPERVRECTFVHDRTRDKQGKAGAARRAKMKT
jgi:hypothetical protein